MPIHCCAMQGRIDAIQALLFFDTEESIKRNLEMENEVLSKTVPELTEILNINSFSSNAYWFLFSCNRKLLPVSFICLWLTTFLTARNGKEIV